MNDGRAGIRMRAITGNSAKVNKDFVVGMNETDLIGLHKRNKILRRIDREVSRLGMRNIYEVSRQVGISLPS